MPLNKNILKRKKDDEFIHQKRNHEALNLYVTSDFHLFHANIIRYSNRPFKDVDEMNETIIQNYNLTIKDDDMVIHLGDLSAGLKKRQNELKALLQRLKGKKILLRGNHDYEPDSFYLEAGFEKVEHFLVIKNYFFNHYALEANSFTNEQEKINTLEFLKSNCNIIVHGHTHARDVNSPIIGYNTSNKTLQRINTCVDANHFYPLKLEL